MPMRGPNPVGPWSGVADFRIRSEDQPEENEGGLRAPPTRRWECWTTIR